jgi:hypothetical protein
MSPRPIQRPYFQHISIDEIRLRIDYKPKHVDIQSLRSGNLIEFMNFVMLTDSNLTCAPVSLSGVQYSSILISNRCQAGPRCLKLF